VIWQDVGMDERTVRTLKDGYARQQAGDLIGARQAYSRVLADDPKNEFALNLMGVVSLRDADAVSAVAYLRAALAVNDRDPETHNNLGLALEALEDLAGAEQAFKRSLDLHPRQPKVLNNLGNALCARNEQVAAIRCYERAITLKPDYAECLGNLALALLAERQLAAAEQAARRGLALDPTRQSVTNALGRVLMGAARYEEAQTCWESALQRDPTLIDAKIQLSIVLKQLRREEPARHLLAQVLSQDPLNTEAHKCLGVLLEQTGDFAGAAAAFRAAIRTAPRHASAYYQLSKLTTARLTDEEMASIQSLLSDPATARSLRGPLCFAMACELEKQSRYGESLDYYIAGNRHRSDAVYDSAADEAYCATLREVTLTTPSGLTPLRFVPIFVLGMPRSGTTLTEQILASHSQINGAGECGALSDLALEAARLTAQPFPHCIAALRPNVLAGLRNRYQEAIIRLAGEAPYIVDKTPANYQLIGLIRAVLPEARVLYCRRDALDNCLSIFRLPFDETQTYSHDLASLGHYYRNHERLMDLWMDRYPQQILTVQYEDTVADLEQQARRMLAFVGVSFEKQVLAFHEAERLILTPSAQQVRRPLYASSIGLWRRYGDGLQPLITALGRAERVSP
jgi:tetratricopeptide (TPR) repeat protein